MRNKLLPALTITSLVIFASCSTGKIAQTDVNDDVYYSVAEAKEATPVAQREREYVTNRDVYADENSYSDRSGYYDDYAVRINRFHRYSPWRSYYDTYYYDPFYSPYAYNRYDRHGINLNIYLGSGYGYGYSPYWTDRYYYGYGYHPYHSNYWGMYSYYNTYPYSYGGYYGNSGYYYGGLGRDIQSSPNYRPRPSRDFDDAGSIRRTTVPNRSGYAPGTGTITDTRSRTERYNDGNRVTPPATTGTRPSTSSSRPTRTETERPTRTSSAPSDNSQGSIQSRPTRVESSFPSSGSGSSSGSSTSGRSDSGNGSSSSSGRPTRGF